MGECGCAGADYLAARRLKDGTVVAVKMLPACHYCGVGQTLVVSFFDSIESDFLDGLKATEVTPDDLGDVEHEITVPLAGPEDLAAAAKEFCPTRTIGGDGYESLAEWLEDDTRSACEFINAAQRRREGTVEVSDAE